MTELGFKPRWFKFQVHAFIHVLGCLLRPWAFQKVRVQALYFSQHLAQSLTPKRFLIPSCGMNDWTVGGAWPAWLLLTALTFPSADRSSTYLYFAKQGPLLSNIGLVRKWDDCLLGLLCTSNLITDVKVSHKRRGTLPGLLTTIVTGKARPYIGIPGGVFLFVEHHKLPFSGSLSAN